MKRVAALWATAEAGYTLVEMLVSTAIIMSVTAAIMTVLVPAQGAFATQPDVSDMQQRLRIGADALAKDLLMAGAGASSGAAAGTLANLMAAIVPRRIGATSPDPVTSAATDRMSLMYVPRTASHTTIHDPIATGLASITLDAGPGCPIADAVCGFKAGMSLVVFDDTGTHDTFTITDVQGPVLQIRHRGLALNKTYGPGARAAEITTPTYWFDNTNARLMKYDGDRTDLPFVDNVVGLRFEYFGEAQAPRITRALSDATGPWTTYGPRPPPVDVDNAADQWAAGENCVFQIDGATDLHAPRLADLGPAGEALVPLTTAMMTDGPWCPDGAAPSRYDADVLRIRQVRVTLRVQTANAALRGPAGPLFSRAGTAHGAGGIVPDHEVRFDVAPRNLNLGR